MNSLERVTLALQHKEPDHVPVYPLINSVSRKSLGINYAEWSQDPEKCAESIIKATEEIGVDVLCTLVDLSVEAADWGQEIEFPEELAAHPVSKNRLIEKPEDYEKIQVIDPTKTPRMKDAIRLTKILYDKKGQEYPVVAFIFGPFGILSMMRGQAEMFVDCLKKDRKPLMHKALRNITETLKQFIKASVDAGAHAVMFDTLYASRTIMSPKMWNEFEGDYIEELCNYVRECGAMVMLHNCGDGIYFKEQLERMAPVAAFSFCHLPPDAESMEDLKAKYGDKTTLIGMIDPGDIMVMSEDELRAECRRQIDAYAKGGGFILATGCEYPAALSYDKAKIMVDEAKNYGAYKK